MTDYISVNPDEKHILAADAHNAILLGEDEEGHKCVLLVPRQIYLAAMAAWLDGKAGYYKRTGKFVGVGCIEFAAKLRTDCHHHLMEYDDYDEVKIDVPTYEATTEFNIDMEHG